ncbi:hypothetical protein [Peribacillus simplex]|uniref:Uncharacterized protein n=1 Tax=Peribacillus simplex TaxID=1478 RepID=A0AAN2TRU1_9BACI|nr:hypothetical protein [Peribacillus simplex]CEG31465.1 hypothetical protein BN1180_01609 [Peribacillus simplex]
MKIKDLIRNLNFYNEEDEVKVYVKTGTHEGHELDLSFIFRTKEKVVMLQGDMGDLTRETESEQEKED